ncbi:uncharacterized protein NPIL_115582 [Nephila pilipes]|uniref:Uncharacterized protein n=1 Tax=Nephila pilipes TaxID=299642 RepID=A0A8X6UKV3_NEPPI|nr:uncharacterized protein NPIL_115582 [Nephila pilipes]
MEKKRGGSHKQEKESISRSHSQELLDSSSASSISVFADHNDGQSSSLRTHDPLADSQKHGEYSPRASMDEALKSEAAFIQYLSSIPPKESSSEHHQSADSMHSRNRSPAAGPTVSKVGLDHLDNLCKLMEQLGELRDTNSRLQKRVQYLEDLKTLHDMHKEICEGGEYSSEDALTSKPGPYPLKKSATESHCPKKEEAPSMGYSRSPSKYLSRRSRHQQSDGQRRGRSKSVGHEDLNEDQKSRRLFPKWSRVKEAFGWESERKDSIKTKNDSAAVLTTRRRSDESSRQTYRHTGSPMWYQDFPSIHSSIEDINEEYEERWKKISVQSEKVAEHLEIPHEGLRRQKSTPSPGSDNIPSYRSGTEMKPKSFTIERDSYRNQDFAKFEKEDGKRGKSPWGRVKTIIERHRDSLKRRSLRQEPSAAELASAISKSNTDSVDFKDYANYMEPASKPLNTSKISKQKGNKPGPLVIEQEIECPRTPSSSPTLQRKSKWTRMTKVLKGKRDGEKESMSLSTPTSPNNQQDGNFTFDIIEENSPTSFREDREISRVGSDSHVHQLALAVPPADLMLQLQRNLSEDFHRKIQEWDRMRGTGITSYSPQWDRKPSETWKNWKKSERPDEKAIKPKIKDLSWLEKELQKVEKEKQRLSKERLKYEQRALRLEKLKETVLGTNNKREVLVRTKAGEFRFEGISDAFTKKLYEWETKKGVGPEFSTIALLDSSRHAVQAGSGTMQRMLSKSESSIADIGHNSSNSLPSVKLSDSADGDRQNHHSKADSEPDLSTLAAAFSGNISASTSIQNTNECLDDEIASPATNKDSEEDELDNQRKGSETYYSLLEENVILLEQLKEKEEICSRLEKDLEILDEKMDEMNTHHAQETQRYREKLWEMHQQGASPRDVLCCRRTMEQLRKRIEVLERWTKKLRNERETVEVHFRHHSKEQESMTLDLLEKMRELQAVGSSTSETDSRKLPRMDANAIERLQDLSALLAKQTQDLQETLNKKTRQICQLKWELLHRDLSNVKLETEQHSHSAQKKRSKYAHWRSRSTEETPVSNCSQKTDPAKYDEVATDAYNISSSVDEFQATDLANTVQQLNKEVQKLTTATEDSQDESLYTDVMALPKSLESLRNYKKSPNKPSLKRITVRRNSADNSSLVSTDDSRLKEDHSSSTHSDDSSDDYYSRICCNSSVKTNFPNNSDTERLLMSFGEYPPRTQRKKKLQKISKLNSSFGRRRSNTFHTNRDLQKPTIVEHSPQKCHSFRVPREICEGPVINRTPYIRRKHQNSNSSARTQIDKNCKAIKSQTFQEATQFNKRDNEFFGNCNISFLREVASDSKIPLIMQIKKYTDQSGEKKTGKLPTRSMSDKTKKETAADKEYAQKKRLKKRLKSPDVPVFTDVGTNSNMSGNLLPQHNRIKCLSSSSQNTNSRNRYENELSREKSDVSKLSIRNGITDVPTITIQLPKRKHRKPSHNTDDAVAPEEQSFTIVMPKKRSLSSECDSSISESSPREESKMVHSDKTNSSLDSSLRKDSTVHTNTDPHLSSSNTKNNENSKGNIRLMKLVSLDNFDSPFEPKESFTTKEYQQSESQKRKRETDDGSCSGKNSPSEEMIDMITAGQNQLLQSDSRNLTKSSTTDLESGHSQNVSSRTNYIKSPSAPQLDWRKACAKKISRSGAPNVRILIERYNQKLIESQTGKSPLSSNVSSPTTPRKISSPVYSSPQEYIPHFNSTPNTPTSSPSYTPLAFKSTANYPKTPPSSPTSLARSEALKKAKEDFIASSPQVSTPNSPVMLRTANVSQTPPQKPTESPWLERRQPEGQLSKTVKLDRTRSDEDRMSNCSMDSMSLVMLRAGENCRESRLPKKTSDSQKSEPHEGHNLKTSKSLSSSSLFKTVLHSDFKVPTNLLKLKRSKRKKDMSTVTELCRQSLLLTTEDTQNILTPASHKSCPSSPELKSKTVVKPNWLQRNIFRHK